ENGGGICNLGTATLTLHSSTVNFNHASSGAGIYSHGNLTLNSSSVYDNHASHFGGGIFLDSGLTASVANSTINSNVATGQFGGGIFASANMTLTNTTLSLNDACGGGAIG